MTDELKDLRNVVNAVQTLHISERDISIRRASFFNQLYEASVVKEAAGCGSAPAPASEHSSTSSPAQMSAPTPAPTRTSTAKGKGKEKRAEQWRKEAEREYLGSKDSAGHTKWTWGVNLTEVDLENLVRGQYRGFALPHSGYDVTLAEGGLRKDSAGRNERDLSDLDRENENPSTYEALSADIRTERELDLKEIPIVFSQFPIFAEEDAAANAALCAGFWLAPPPADYVQAPLPPARSTTGV